VIPFSEEEETMDRNPSDSTTKLGEYMHMHVTPSTSNTVYRRYDVVCMSADVASSLLVRIGCMPLLGWNRINSKAHLSCGNELKWSQCGLQVGGVGLEIVKSASDAGLELGWLLARWARGRDLVEGTHGCGCREKESFRDFAKFEVEFQQTIDCVCR
jgi:hypothetical protein